MATARVVAFLPTRSYLCPVVVERSRERVTRKELRPAASFPTISGRVLAISIKVNILRIGGDVSKPRYVAISLFLRRMIERWRFAEGIERRLISSSLGQRETRERRNDLEKNRISRGKNDTFCYAIQFLLLFVCFTVSICNRTRDTTCPRCPCAIYKKKKKKKERKKEKNTGGNTWATYDLKLEA